MKLRRKRIAPFRRNFVGGAGIKRGEFRVSFPAARREFSGCLPAEMFLWQLASGLDR
jgi:hypothetical protein